MVGKAADPAYEGVNCKDHCLVPSLYTDHSFSPSKIFHSQTQATLDEALADFRTILQNTRSSIWHNLENVVFGQKKTFGCLKVVASEKIGGSGVTSTLGTWYGGVVMGVLLYFNKAAILYRDFNSAQSQKQNIIVFAANNSRCCKCYVAPTIIL